MPFLFFAETQEMRSRIGWHPREGRSTNSEGVETTGHGPHWHMGGDGVQNALALLPHFSRLSDQKTVFFKSSAISFTPLFISRSEPDPLGPLEPLTLVEVCNTD